MKKIMLIIGTRPEAIKMCPLVIELKKRKTIQVVVCVTGQHREMLDMVLTAFSIVPDYDLNIMRTNQTLFDITQNILGGIKPILENEKPDLVLVHGDTTTSYVTALSCFYMNIKIGHVEAGLRTNDMYSPFPEEFNRQSVDLISEYLFAPTERAKQNLLKEHKKENRIFVTGNTVIDALKTTVSVAYKNQELDWAKGARLLLLTAHRRENRGTNMKNIFRAISRITSEYDDVKVLYPVHMNPEIISLANEYFQNNPKVHIVKPLEVIDFHNIMAKSFIIVTDSGGIQEEAPALGIPVLVTRNTTERPEGVDAGTLKLVGVEEERIYTEIKLLLDCPDKYKMMSEAVNPYGDGLASKRIADIIEKIE